VAADFNRDGISDVAAAHFSSNTVTVSLGNGDGTFGAPLSLAINRNPYALAAGDFNGDGFPDLASTNLGTGTVAVLINAADWSPGPTGWASRVAAPGAPFNGATTYPVTPPGAVPPVADLRPADALFAIAGRHDGDLTPSGPKHQELAFAHLGGLRKLRADHAPLEWTFQALGEE
jgi:hypothetical protein